MGVPHVRRRRRRNRLQAGNRRHSQGSCGAFTRRTQSSLAAAIVVGATGRTSVYTRQPSARLSAQLQAQPTAQQVSTIVACPCIRRDRWRDRLRRSIAAQRLLHVNTPIKIIAGNRGWWRLAVPLRRLRLRRSMIAFYGGRSWCLRHSGVARSFRRKPTRD